MTSSPPTEINVTDPACRVITELYNGEKELITPAMTKYQNALGGTVIVMGLTVESNGSQALFNYRRKHLLQKLVTECCDEFCLVKQAPDVMIVENKATDPASDFKEILTLVNTCADALDEVVLHLPPTLREPADILMLDSEGAWLPVVYSRTGDGVTVHHALEYCQPMYLMIR